MIEVGDDAVANAIDGAGKGIAQFGDAAVQRDCQAGQRRRATRRAIRNGVWYQQSQRRESSRIVWYEA